MCDWMLVVTELVVFKFQIVASVIGTFSTNLDYKMNREFENKCSQVLGKVALISSSHSHQGASDCRGEETSGTVDAS